jgi:Kef-type K+ transport system membrane component KefB/nucleotide-binding universal stress UspA family protein
VDVQAIGCRPQGHAVAPETESLIPALAAKARRLVVAIAGRGARTAPRLAGAAAAILAATDEAAAAAGGSQPSTALFFIQLATLVLVGRLVGEALQRAGQPNVMGPLIAGLLLGPSVLGFAWPAAEAALFPDMAAQKGMLNGIAQFGVLLLLLLAGMGTDVGLIRRSGRAALAVSMTGILMPFSCGFGLGQALPDAMLPNPEQRLVTSLFLGTALSISSVKIVATVVREMGFVRRNLGQVILASAVIDDTIGWVIIAVTFGLASSGQVSLASVSGTVGGTLLFLGLSLTLGRRAVFHIIRWVNDTFVSEMAVASTVILIMLAMALITHAIGVHEVLGAFVAGILVGQSPILTRRIDEQLRAITTALFMPVFFGLSGLGADLSVLLDPSMLALALGLVAIASIGKFAGAFAGAWLGGLNRHEALALGFGMNARGSTEVIVATIGLSMGALSQDLFTMIVAMAVVTTMVMPPTLRWALQRVPTSEGEQKRLEREAFEARAFLSNIERLLLAADASASGELASRIAGLLAAARGMPVTSLRVRDREDLTPAVPDQDIVATAAAAAKPAGSEGAPADVDVITVDTTALTPEIVESEARKGFDFLLIGRGGAVLADGTFSDELSDVVRNYDGALAFVAAGAGHRDAGVTGPLDILLPLTGTAANRAAAEIACVLAQRSGSRLRAVHVVTATSPKGWRGRRRSRRDARPIFRDLSAIAEHHGVRVVSAGVKIAATPAEAILELARVPGPGLIVLGVNRRAGETLSFGETVTAVLARTDQSVLLVSPRQL